MSPSQNRSSEERTEVFVISVAAEKAGMHAQTLRTYDRMGLVTPQRTRGGGRRYSSDDIELLREIQRLSHEEGVNLAGIKAIIDLQNEVDQLRNELLLTREKLRVTQEQLRHARDESHNAAARSRGEIVHVPRSTAVVMWEPRRGRTSRTGRDSRDGRR